MTNETPENQPTPPAGGQHDFGAHLSSAPDGSADSTDEVSAAQAAPEEPPVPETPAGSEAPAAAASAPEALAPEALAPEASAPAAPEPEASAVPPYPVAPYPEAAPAAPQAAMPGGYPDQAPTAPEPGAPAEQPGQAPTAAYPAATAPYPGAAAGTYDPNAAQAYDPNAAQATPGAYDPNAYPGGAPAAPPKKKSRKGLLWGLIGGGVVLLLLIAAAIIVPMIIKSAQPTASDAAEAYLQAIAAGDSEAAMEYIETLGTTELLTDEVLQKSIELAPIDGIEVGEPQVESGAHEIIPVVFTVGGDEVSRDFDVYRHEDGWKVDGLVAAGVYTDVGDAGLTINGVPVVQDGYVFPGTYEFAIDNDSLALAGESSTFRLITNDDNEALWDLEAEPTEAGIEQFRTLVAAAVEECVAMKTLATPCGMDISDIDLSGATPVEGSVTRTLTDEGKQALESLEVFVVEGGVVSTSDSIEVDTTLEGDNGGKRYEYEVWLGGWLDDPTVDLLAENPEVVWE